MKAHEKIQKLLLSAGISVNDLYQRQKKFFPKNECLSLNAYKKVINGESSPRFSTMLKLCQLLEISLLELIEDTEFNDSFLMRYNNRLDSYMYNDKAKADIISSPLGSFITMELILEPGAQTKPEVSPTDQKYEKCIYVMEGRLKLFIDDEEYNLKRRDSITFNSRKAHYYQNNHSRRCMCLMTLSPKHL
jgi:transcriptional regulator with XRE-family HTH domain